MRLRMLSSIYRRRQWHPTPVLLPGKSYGQRSLVSCSPWGRKEQDTTERLHFHFSLSCVGEENGNPLVFLPGESQGRGSLVGCRLWGRTESDTTEATQQQHNLYSILFQNWGPKCKPESNLSINLQIQIDSQPTSGNKKVSNNPTSLQKELEKEQSSKLVENNNKDQSRNK